MRRGFAPCLAAAVIAGICAVSIRSHAAEAVAVSCEKPPVIDGRLDDACWVKAVANSSFQPFREKAARPETTSFKVAFDQEWLYFGFTCRNQNASFLTPTVLEHDGGVHMDDSVEIFLDPGSGGRLYFHYMLSFANVKAEKRVLAGGKRDVKWDLPWRSATRRHADGWDAEIALPLYALASFGDLATARLNVARNIAVPDVDPQGVAQPVRRIGEIWSPIVRTFHEPESFVPLKGLAGVKVRVPFLASAEDETLGAYYQRDGSTFYDVDLRVRSHTPKSGKVTVTVLDEPVVGERTEVAQEVALKGSEAQPLKLFVPVRSFSDRAITVLLADAETGLTLQKTIIADTSILNLMTAYLDRNYYTTEKSAEVICSVGLPDEALKDKELVVLSADGKLLGRTAPAAKAVRVAVDVARLPVGAREFKAELREGAAKGGQSLFSQSMEFVKLAPKPGCEWKVDREQDFVLNNGEAFFPFGMGMGGITHEHPEALKDLADAGFNTAKRWTSPVYKIEPEDAAKYLDIAQQHGLYVLDRCETYFKMTTFKGRSATPTSLKGMLMQSREMTIAERNAVYAATLKEGMPRLLDATRRIMDYPNLIATNNFDEPCGRRFFDQVDFAKQMYDDVRRVDPYHPMVILYSSYIPEGDEYTAPADIIATDPYWVPCGSEERGTPNFVSKIVSWTKKRADGVHKATWIVPMAHRYSGTHKRGIAPAEQFCQTYLAIIHGAKGLFYFVYPVPDRAWKMMRDVARQLKVLGPIAVTDDIPQEIRYEPGTFEPEKEKYPDIQVNLRHNPKGGYVLLAANSRYYPVDVTYKLSCLGAVGAVSRIFGPETYRIANGTFSDALGPFETRAYTFQSVGDLALPVAIQVTMKGHPDAVQKETGIPRTGRPGKKNILPNPSFEESTLPPLPDYWWESEHVTENPYHGKYCVRINKPEGKWVGPWVYISPYHDKATAYVFSVYLRAEKAGTEVELSGGGMDAKVVKVDTEWKRYFTTGRVSARADAYGSISFRVRGREAATVWADAAQFETGLEPTAFED